MPKTRREFSPEFKRETVALLESSGRPLMQVATEVGISPLMLRNWRAAICGGAARTRAAELGSRRYRRRPIRRRRSRLKRELDRTRMERDVLKRMARPVRKGFVKDGMLVCINVSDLKADALAKMDIRAVWSS